MLSAFVISRSKVLRVRLWMNHGVLCISIQKNWGLLPWVVNFSSCKVDCCCPYFAVCQSFSFVFSTSLCSITIYTHYLRYMYWTCLSRCGIKFLELEMMCHTPLSCAELVCTKLVQIGKGLTAPPALICSIISCK